jgi:hypothetical protein
MLDLRPVGHSPKQSLLAIVGKKQRRKLDEFAMKIMSGYGTSDLVDVGVMNHLTLPNSGYSFVFVATSRTFPNQRRSRRQRATARRCCDARICGPVAPSSIRSTPAFVFAFRLPPNRQWWVDRQFQHLSASTAG